MKLHGPLTRTLKSFAAIVLLSTIATTVPASTAFATPTECEANTSWVSYNQIEVKPVLTHWKKIPLAPGSSHTQEQVVGLKSTLTASVQYNNGATIGADALIAGLEVTGEFSLAAAGEITLSRDLKQTWVFDNVGGTQTRTYMLFAGVERVTAKWTHYRCDSRGMLMAPSVGDLVSWETEGGGTAECLTPGTDPMYEVARAKCSFTPVSVPDNLVTTYSGVYYCALSLCYGRQSDGTTPPSAPPVVDFSGDGKADVIARNSSTGDIQLYRGNGAGGFQAGTGGVIGNNWSGFDIIFSPGDFSGDGKADVIARNSSTGDIQLYRGNGAGGFQAGTGGVIGNNWSGFDIIFSPGDFSGDGKADVIARNSSTGDIQLYRGNGAGGFQAGTGGVIGNNWAGFDIIFSPGDFSGDGKPDVLARNSATTDLQLYKGNGAGGFQAGTGGVIGNNWSGFSAIFSPGDFSGDGRPDVLARNSATTDLQLYKGNGAGGFQTGTGSVISNNWSGFNIIF